MGPAELPIFFQLVRLHPIDQSAQLLLSRFVERMDDAQDSRAKALAEAVDTEVVQLQEARGNAQTTSRALAVSVAPSDPVSMSRHCLPQ